MADITYQYIQPNETKILDMLGNWYEGEWQIPKTVSMEKIKGLSESTGTFHVLMLLDKEPIAAGGVHSYVGLIDKVPRLAVYPHWLALVYTKPEYRGKGYGAALCAFIEQRALALGVKEMHLHTNSAESLYQRLGWHIEERFGAELKDFVVMRKAL